jgi:predicted nucleotide-binding protein
LAELAKCVGILDAVNNTGKEALDKSLVHIFISHGKFTPAFSKLELFLRALGSSPIYDTAEPTEGRTINQHVEKLFSEAEFHIILATGETKNEKGDIFPNHNVIIEYDRLLKDKPNEIIVFLETGVKMPSMVQDIIYASFSQECMDDALTKLVRELAGRGLLKS